MTQPESIQQPEEAAAEHRRVRQAIVLRIETGGWKPGELIPNAKAMAVEYQTSHEAASRVMRQLVDEGMLRASRDGRTVVSPYHNSIHKRRETLHITVVLGPDTPDIDYQSLDKENDHLYFGPILRGVVEATAGKQVDIHFERLATRDYVRYVQESDSDGFILITPGIEDLPVLHDLLEVSKAFVATSISSGLPEHAILPCVDSTNREGAQAAAHYLAGLGHTRIGVINLSMSLTNHVDRLDGFQDALHDRGIKLDQDLVLLRSGYEYSEFDHAIDEWLSRLQKLKKLPTAVFTCDFEMTLSAVTVFQHRNIVLPTDMSLVGFDDPLAASHMSPPITTVRQPIYGIGLRAGQRLIEAISSPGGPRTVVGTEMLRTQLMVRESSGPPPANPAGAASASKRKRKG
ncbi:MAG: substrate-binding domain-containing protein [Capsulimonadaceae bacterium]